MTRAQRRSDSQKEQGIHGSVDAREVEKFSAIAEEWWDARGKFAPLHRLNPVRLAFVRSQCAAHFGRGGPGLQPFGGLTLLDIGCGGGLLSEPMARLGFSVMGVDASDRNLKVAALHARESDLSIAYRSATAEELAAQGVAFDVVLNMEVIEHVADVELFLDACAALVKPGGLMFVATINKTVKSLAFAKFGAEYVLGWLPAGTHDWGKFLAPGTLRSALARRGLACRATQGITFDPIAWDWRASRDTDVNYMLVAERPNSSR